MNVTYRSSRRARRKGGGGVTLLPEIDKTVGHVYHGSLALWKDIDLRNHLWKNSSSGKRREEWGYYPVLLLSSL